MNLSVSNLFFELALIFLPGFVWMKIHKKYGLKGESSQFDLILNAFIFGVVSYAILTGIYWACGWNLKITDIDTDNKKLLQPDIMPEICYAVLISLIFGIIHLFIENKKLFTQFVQKIGATNTYGDEDVWDFVFNSSSNIAKFVHVKRF